MGHPEIERVLGWATRPSVSSLRGCTTRDSLIGVVQMIYRGFVLLLVTSISAIAQSAPKVLPTASISAPETMINALYRNVVIHHPYSLLEGVSAKTFSPYLSEMLAQKLQAARGCSRDWF